MPVGGFLAFHLWENSTEARGADAYNEMARALHEFPLLLAIELLFILAPLLYHGVYGLFLVADPRREPLGSPYARGWVVLLQRVTGVVVFAFMLFHLWTTRLVQLSEHESLDLFRQVQAALANPWIYAFYVAGILSATSHLASGLWSFSIAWGLTPRPGARRAMAWVSAIVFVGLSWIGLSGIRAFRM